ncbi:MAG: hypothetical protein R3C20_06265 [Planctomycetaceae bacterium]
MFVHTSQDDPREVKTVLAVPSANSVHVLLLRAVASGYRVDRVHNKQPGLNTSVRSFIAHFIKGQLL